MSSGPKNVTSTTNTRPPAFLEGPLSNAAWFTNLDFSDYRNNLASGSSPAKNLIGDTQGLVSNTIQGNFLGPDTNPFLQQTFNRAADLTRTRLDSEFAGAGRNLGASLPARSEELQTLASNIYGQNFQAERDRQMGAIGSAQQLDPLNMFINRLAGLIPGAGGSTQSTQPVFRTGLF